MQDRPQSLPTTGADGAPLKSLTGVLLERRATVHFDPTENVPDETLRAMLELTAQAPSGYNLQPWRFIVVRDAENRKRLQAAAYGQPKVAEAPVVVICVGMKEEWKEDAPDIFREGAERGAGRPDTVDQFREGAMQFLSHLPMQMWVNRHTMIAATTLMYVAEAYGYDTAPMEGLDPEKVKSEFGIPEEGEVVCLMAIGRRAEPDKAYPGRFAIEDIMFGERFGEKLELQAK